MDLRKVLLDNWGIKLISLGFSIALWFYVTATGQTEMTLTVPLELHNVPPGLTVVGNVTSTVEVRVQGQERILRDGAFGKKMVGIIDLSMSRVGENTVRLSPDDIKRPEGIVVTHMSLSEVKVQLEPLLRRVYWLRPVLHGAPAAGYRLAGISVVPAKITVEGPAGVMKSLNRLETMPIDIDGAREGMTVEPKIDYQGQPVKLLEKNIVVRIDIERARKK